MSVGSRLILSDVRYVFMSGNTKLTWSSVSHRLSRIYDAVMKVAVVYLLGSEFI